jgi:hypothetical protein
MQSLIRTWMVKQSHMAEPVSRCGGRSDRRENLPSGFCISVRCVEDETSARPVPLQTNRTPMLDFRFQSLTPANEVSGTSQLLCSAEFVHPTTFNWWASFRRVPISLFKYNPVYLVYFISDLLVHMNYTRSCLYWPRNRFCNSFYSWLYWLTCAIPRYHRIPVFSNSMCIISQFFEINYLLLVYMYFNVNFF